MYDGRLFPHSGARQVIPEVCLVTPRLDEDAVLVDLPVRLVGVPVGVVRRHPALLPDEQSCSKLWWDNIAGLESANLLLPRLTNPARSRRRSGETNPAPAVPQPRLPPLNIRPDPSSTGHDQK